jgi:adenosine deaminase
VALGADDPLLFGQRLTAQYQLAREVHGLSDGELAELARMSVRGSAAPAEIRARQLAGIDAWLASPDPGPARAAARQPPQPAMTADLTCSADAADAGRPAPTAPRPAPPPR